MRRRARSHRRAFFVKVFRESQVRCRLMGYVFSLTARARSTEEASIILCTQKRRTNGVRGAPCIILRTPRAWLPGLRGIETQQANGLLRAGIGGPEGEQWRVDHRQQFSGQRRVGLDQSRSNFSWFDSGVVLSQLARVCKFY